MARQILLVPEGVFTGQIPIIHPGMLEDLLALADVPPTRLDRLAEGLTQEQGLPTAARLEGLVTQHLGETPLVEPVMNALTNLRPRQIEETVRTLRRWGDSNPDNTARLPSEKLERIRDRLSRLVQDYPVMVRYRKAQSLKARTGRTAESLEIICDLRPVFDETRTIIEGLIPLMTLRIAYQGGEGEGSLEVLLSQDDLECLAEEVTKANQKLESLAEAVQGWLPQASNESDR